MFTRIAVMQAEVVEERYGWRCPELSGMLDKYRRVEEPGQHGAQGVVLEAR